jgi:very-short-patch-repair endonuclease
MSRYSVGRAIAKQIIREDKKRRTHGRILKEAEARPESIRVETAAGDIWMSPIEHELYQAMRKEGLSPTPQFRIEWYTVDFAFPDIKVAIEADGASYHSGDRREHDRKRDASLRHAGWTVKRFHGTTIYHRASNCAYVVKQEVESRRAQAKARARHEEMERQARNEAIARPFRKIARLLKRKEKR